MWPQIINAALGIWLMAAPGVGGFGKTIADNDQIVGPIIATFAITAIFENTRPVRKFNIPLGVWLLLAPWLLSYENQLATINDMAVGALVIGFSFIKGKIKHQYGGGWPSLWRGEKASQAKTGS